jgi:hypothetical protein
MGAAPRARIESITDADRSLASANTIHVDGASADIAACSGDTVLFHDGVENHAAMSALLLIPCRAPEALGLEAAAWVERSTQ